MSAGRVYEFAEFRLDAVERLLFRNGKRVPLTPKTVDGIFPYSAKRSRRGPKAANSSRPSRSGDIGLSLPSPRWQSPVEWLSQKLRPAHRLRSGQYPRWRR